MGIKNVIHRTWRYIRYGIPVEEHPQITNVTKVFVKQMAPNNILNGRCILIVGGGRGLGYYIAKKCVQEGAKVIIAGRNEKQLVSSAKEIGGQIKVAKLDISCVDVLGTFLQEAEKLWECKIDSLVNCAGISLHEGEFRNVTSEGWDAQMGINLKGNFFLTKEFISFLETHEDRSGNIIVLSSERGKRADDIPYGLTKVATNSFVQAIASKVIQEGIRLNAVCPGVTASDMTGFDRNNNLYAEWQANKRIYLPEEVAEVVLFLLSDVSACISGETITCNEGRHISHW